MIEVAVSGSITRTDRDKIRYFRCREYDNLAIDCSNMVVAEKDQSDKMQ